jgi:RNA polymerase sigma factor (TIGR02999 family)
MASVTQLLNAAKGGDQEASARMFELLYADLKRMARNSLRGNGGVSELNTTALVHESFLKFIQRRQLSPVDRAAFFTYVGKVMRSVLIDSIRERQAAKRGGGNVVVSLTTDVADESFDDSRLLALNAALDALSRIAPKLHQLVEMRYFAGLSIREISDILGVSERTVERDWDKARGFLRRLMDEG